MTTARLNISTKDIIYIITIVGMIVTFFVRFALIEAKVEHHDEELKTHSLDIIEDDITEIKEDLKEIKLMIREL